MREGSRRHRKALERQDRGYLGAWAVPAVDDADWVSQFDAADRIGVPLVWVGALIQGGRLEPAHNSAGQAGVLSRTVEAQARRRAGAGPLKRAWIYLADVMGCLYRGI